MKNPLKEKRVAQGYKSASEFCRRNNLPISTYISHENGTRPIGIKYATRYAQIFNSSVNEILDISELNEEQELIISAFILGRISTENNINLSQKKIDSIVYKACKIYRSISRSLKTNDLMSKMEYCVNLALAEMLSKHGD